MDTPCCAWSISGFCTAGTASTVNNLAVFRPLVEFVLLLRVLAVPKYPQYAQYEVYFDRLCTVSTILRPIVRHKTLPDSPTSGSWSKLLSPGITRVLRALAVFRHIYALRVLSVFRGSALRILPVLQVFRVSILRVQTYKLAYALGVRYCSYSRYSQYLGLLSTRNILAASTPILSVLGLWFVLEHYIFICESLMLPWAPRNLYFGGIYTVCAASYSAGHTALWRKLDLDVAQLFCTYVYAAYIELLVANHLFRINIHLPVPCFILL